MTAPSSTERRTSSSTLIARSTTPTRTTRRSWGYSMAIRVKSPGLLTTVQDTGRLGEYAIGMPPSGAMDVFSYQVGNYLVGTEEGAAGLGDASCRGRGRVDFRLPAERREVIPGRG